MMKNYVGRVGNEVPAMARVLASRGPKSYRDYFQMLRWQAYRDWLLGGARARYTRARIYTSKVFAAEGV
jgi:hypothetical protein